MQTKVFIKRPSGRRAYTTKQSVFTRTTEILNELGIDRQSYLNDQKLRILNKMQSLQIPLQG